MARGSKAKYTDKQKRQAEHIEAGYRDDGMPAKEAARRAWATVNAQDGGGKKSGSGRAKARRAPATQAAATHKQKKTKKSGGKRQTGR